VGRRHDGDRAERVLQQRTAGDPQQPRVHGPGAPVADHDEIGVLRRVEQCLAGRIQDQRRPRVDLRVTRPPRGFSRVPQIRFSLSSSKNSSTSLCPEGIFVLGSKDERRSFFPFERAVCGSGWRITIDGAYGPAARRSAGRSKGRRAYGSMASSAR
jgi:hypothetical protein